MWIREEGKTRHLLPRAGGAAHRHDGASGTAFHPRIGAQGLLEIGGPDLLRQIRVGEVVAYNLSEDGTKIISKIFVNAPYHQFVRSNTRFWSASGVGLETRCLRRHVGKPSH